ncbi:Arc family DNA-binding protein [Halomonas pacifica]|uniref:Arc family DNA-binding protein n=1 Tax=Bisbaumannia pacifica TaxID=77098 RepID=UPI002359F8EF|nr:Arc family DNA-binding protein [Halomonas pacifica]MDC8803949.1 Arc family DNA-binding protein [Halomonas pacifica]
MPDDVRKALKAAAQENGRSMNAEIVARLQESLDLPSPGAGEDEIALIEIRRRLDSAHHEVAQLMKEYYQRVARMEQKRVEKIRHD